MRKRRKSFICPTCKYQLFKIFFVKVDCSYSENFDRKVTFKYLKSLKRYSVGHNISGKFNFIFVNLKSY